MKHRHLTTDIIAAALVIIALVALLVVTLPGYLERSDDPEPAPINTGVVKVSDVSRGLENVPCLLVVEGC